MSETGPSSRDAFVERAGQSRTGFIGEYVEFLAHNKKWWLAPDHPDAAHRGWAHRA